MPKKNNSMFDILSSIPSHVEIYPPKNDNNMITSTSCTDHKKHFDNTKDNTYISVHIQRKSSNRLSDYQQVSNEKLKTIQKSAKENDPQKYFVKCNNNKSDQTSKKYCKECKNYRTKLKVSKLDEQIAENKKLNEKGEEITNYVSKFVSLFGLQNTKNEKHVKHHTSSKNTKYPTNKHSQSHENITSKPFHVDRKSRSVSVLTKQVLPQKLKLKHGHDETLCNKFMSSVIFTEKDIVNLDARENQIIENYSVHSLEKYQTTPIMRKQCSKRQRHHDNTIGTKPNSTKCKKLNDNGIKNDRHFIQMTEKRTQVNTEKLLNDNKSKSMNPQKSPNDRELLVKKLCAKGIILPSCKRKEKKLTKVDRAIKKDNGNHRHKSKVNIGKNSIHTQSNIDNQIINELKLEVKANRKHLIHMERMLIKKLCEHDKKEFSPQLKIKGIESKNDVKVVNKCDPLLEQQDQPKNVRITKKIIFMNKKDDVPKFTYKLGHIQEILHENKKANKQIVSNTRLCTPNMSKESIFDKSLQKDFIIYPTILWPYIFEPNTQCLKSSMEQINELIIPTSSLFQFYTRNSNQLLSQNIVTKRTVVTQNDTPNTTKTIGTRNSDFMFKKSTLDQRLRQCKSMPFCLSNNFQDSITLKNNIKFQTVLPTYKQLYNKYDFMQSTNKYIIHRNNELFMRHDDKPRKQAWIDKIELDKSSERLERQCKTEDKQHVNKNESNTVPRIHRRKMVRSRSEMHSLEEFYRRYRRTASLPPSNISNSNISTHHSTTSLSSILNSKKYLKNVPLEQKYNPDKSKTPIRGDYDHFQNPKESNTKKKSTNNTGNSTNQPSTNSNDNHSMASTSAAPRIDTPNDTKYDIERQYMDSIKRHLEYLKQQQEEITKRDHVTTLNFNDIKKNLLSHNFQTKIDTSKPPLSVDKVRFSKVAENRKTTLKSKQILQTPPKVKTDDKKVKSNLEDIQTMDTKLKLDQLLRQSNTELNWDENIRKLEKLDNVTNSNNNNNITISCDPLPTDTKVTVSFERNSLKQEVTTLNSNDLMNCSSKNDVEQVEQLSPKVQTKLLTSTNKSPLIKSLQNMVERNPTFKNELKSTDHLITNHINKLSQQLIDTLSELTTKSTDVKKHELEQLIKNYNKEVTTGFFNIMSTSTHQLNHQSDTSTDTPSGSNDYATSDPNPKSSSGNLKNKVKKHVSIKLSSDTRPRFMLPDIQSTTSLTKTEENIENIETMSEIDLEFLKNKQRETLEKVRLKRTDSYDAIADTPKSVLSLAAVDSIILKKKEVVRRKSQQNGADKQENSTESKPTKRDGKEDNYVPRLGTDGNDEVDFPSISQIIDFNPSDIRNDMFSKPMMLKPIQKKHKSSNLDTKNASTNLIEKNISDDPRYLKYSEADINREFSSVIFLENQSDMRAVSSNFFVDEHIPEIVSDSEPNFINPPVNADNELKQIDLVDNIPLLTETEKFNILLNSFTILKNVIDTPSATELSKGLPPSLQQHEMILPNEQNFHHASKEQAELDKLQLDAISTNTEITIEAVSGTHEEFSPFQSAARIKKVENDETANDNTKTSKYPSTLEKVDCKCVDKCKILTEEILKKADCECIKQGKGNVLETCACIQRTDRFTEPIRVVCGHVVRDISEQDKCRCKIDEHETSDITSQQQESSTNTDIKIRSASISNFDINLEDIGACFRRGFRADNVALSGKLKHDGKKIGYIRSNLVMQSKQMGVNFSEQRTPLDFLISLGFSVDEASIALRNEDIKNRLSAAITEARIWCNFVTVPQGTLLYLLAYKARASTMRYFLQIVEAIINSRIPDAVQLDGFIKLLDKLESGHLPMLLIFGTNKINFDTDDTRNVQKQLQNLFVNMFAIAKKEASDMKRTFTSKDTKLLEHLTTFYRPGLYPHLELIAKYVGRGQLVSVVQMEAAIIYLSRLSTKEVDLEEFETYCGMNSDDMKSFTSSK